MHEVNP